ncbi:HET-domain-containing protein [Zopfia rhizophila CBS 207.26]|uniref:HET-domain-containing protein n=1 Tax=Zopfia rhizophila CBS 207.26 TaxID=1314779 RepID=A0A6A6DS46_9PEZI|nr:HET-domain-containing protein [Zopfia rhizophila CBS 207.26]
MDVFKYEPIDLDGPTFRLLRLLKGREFGIECELFQAWIHRDRAIPYEALSYTWGGTEMTERVKINGKSLGVTENLYLALQHLRPRDRDRILWVDAICIDQGNEKERGHQVQQMRNIYAQADQVIVWLGSATYATNVLMDSLKQLQEESTKHACTDWKPTSKRWMDLWLAVQPILKGQHLGLVTQQRAGMELLLERPWFKRIWILQEVANAKTAIVCSGAKSVSARVFALTPFLVGTKPDSYCQAVLDIMPGPSKKYSCKASDPRDMIYALLGISSDGRDINNLRADYMKTPQQVVHDSTSFLFGLSDFPYHTIPEFLRNFTSLNTKALARVIKSYNTNNVATFLVRRGDKVNVTEEVVKAAAQNIESGREVMALLLQRRGYENTESGREVVRAAAQSDKEVMVILLKLQGGKVKITEKVAKAAAGNIESGREVMALLLKQRGDKVKVTKEVVKAAAGNRRRGKEVMALLLEQRGDEVKVTEEVVRAAAGNLWSGKEVMALLLKQRIEGFKITQGLVTEEMVKAAAGNTRRNEVMALLLKQRIEAILLKQRGDEVEITEEVVKAAAGNIESGKELMALLLEQRGDEIKVTEEVVKAAARNWSSGKDVIALLLEQRGDEVKVTKEVVKAAVRTWSSGKEVIALLLKQAAVGNTGKRKRSIYIELLLKQRGDEIKVIGEVV